MGGRGFYFRKAVNFFLGGGALLSAEGLYFFRESLLLEGDRYFGGSLLLGAVTFGGIVTLWVRYFSAVVTFGDFIYILFGGR